MKKQVKYFDSITNVEWTSKSKYESEEDFNTRNANINPRPKFISLVEPEDAVSPKHYSEMAISPLEYNNANNIGWNEGNVIKYISRYKNKNGLEDLKKAQYYLNDLIERIENEKQ